MPAPTADALRHRRSAQKWARSGMVSFTLASVVANVTVISQITSSPLRILIAGLAPLVLVKMSHLLTKLLQAGLTDSATPKLINWAAAAAVAAIGAGAFYLSYETLRRAAEPDHGGGAWVFPFTLDLAIVVCTAVLVVIARANEHDERVAAAAEAQYAAPVQVAATTASEREPQPTQVTKQRRDSHELPAMPPEQLAAMHRETQSFQIAPTAPLRNLTTDAVPAANREPQPASPAMQTPTNREADTDELALTSGDSRESLPARREAPAPIRRLAAVPAPRFAAESPEEQVTARTPAHREVEAEQVTARTPAHRDSEREQVTTQTDAVREAADDANRDADAGSEAAVRGPEPTPEQIELAQAVIDAGKTKASLEVAAAIIAAKSAGMANKAAAAAVDGADTSLVQRVWTAAKEIAA